MLGTPFGNGFVERVRTMLEKEFLFAGFVVSEWLSDFYTFNVVRMLVSRTKVRGC